MDGRTFYFLHSAVPEYLARFLFSIPQELLRISQPVTELEFSPTMLCDVAERAKSCSSFEKSGKARHHYYFFLESVRGHSIVIISSFLVEKKMVASVVVRPSLWSQFKKVPVKYPMAFGVVISGFKTSFSDLLVQKVVERRENVDWKRNAAFATFGFIYLGGVQYTLYVPIFGRLFPGAAQFAAKPLAQKLTDAKGMMQLFGQTFLDQCVHHPLAYFPAFYVTRELVMAEKPDIVRVLKEYQKNMKEDLLALWKIWVPATMANFAFMPMHLRIPCVAATSLVWTCILSSMRGGDVAHSEDMAGGAVTGASYSLLQEGLDAFNTSPVELDDNMYHVNISAAGKDRTGLVADLSRHIAKQGGNVTSSKMQRLGEEFIIQMHVAIQPEKASNFVKSLKSRELTRHLDIQTTRLTKRCSSKNSVFGMRMHCVGEDR